MLMMRTYFLCLFALLFAACGADLQPAEPEFEVPPRPAEWSDGKADHLGSPHECASDKGHELYTTYLPVVLNGNGAGSATANPGPARPPMSSWWTTRRVLVVNFDPTLSNGRTINEHYGWQDPGIMAQRYADAIRSSSGGAVRYEVVDRLDLDAFPPVLNRPAFTADSWQAMYDGCPVDASLCPTNTCEQYDPVSCPNPEARADYAQILAGLDVCRRVEGCEIDEVWMFGAPHLGFYESRMVGDGAFFVNAPPLQDSCQRRYLVMGFNPERGLDAMLHDMGHVLESVLGHAFRNWRPLGTTWADSPAEIFRRYRSGVDPMNPWSDKAACGDTHNPPNALGPQYVYDTPDPVVSMCDQFWAYPSFQTTGREVTCAEWGCTHEGYLQWQFDRVPRRRGTFGNHANNWWKYVAGFNHYVPDSCEEVTDATDCREAAGCRWSVCSTEFRGCFSSRFDRADVCAAQECIVNTTVDACDAAGCAWYACSESCFPRGTPLETACP